MPLRGEAGCARVSGVARGGDAEAGILKVPRRTDQKTASASRGRFAPYGLGALRLGFPRLPARRISPRFPRRFRTATNFDIMKRVMFRHKQTQAYKLGVNVMFYAFNQYYHRHYEQ